MPTNDATNLDGWRRGVDASLQYHGQVEDELRAENAKLRLDLATLQALVESHVTREALPRFQQHDHMRVLLVLGRPEEGTLPLTVRVINVEEYLQAIRWTLFTHKWVLVALGLIGGVGVMGLLFLLLRGVS